MIVIIVFFHYDHLKHIRLYYYISQTNCKLE